MHFYTNSKVAKVMPFLLTFFDREWQELCLYIIEEGK
jgi:hypothetical protein